MKEARHWENRNDKIQCKLCHHNCLIGLEKRGVCGVRENRDRKLYSLIYGLASSVHPDPIEKKPLYHFHPGSNVLSFGTVGCNFKCAHCQNYTISQSDLDDGYLRHLELEEIISKAERFNCQGISWTYNEPTIWYEFTYDGCKTAKENGLYTCYVTNGYIMEEPLREISKYLDAMNIDVKAFRNEFYLKICKAELEPVLETAKLAREFGIFIELTYLIIPRHNDSDDEIRGFCKWVVKELGEEVPCHFSRFHPDYRMMGVPPTPMETMMKAYEIGKGSGLRYVYLGNVPHGNYENTYCPNCNALLIERFGYSTRVYLRGDRCQCGQNIPLVQRKL